MTSHEKVRAVIAQARDIDPAEAVGNPGMQAMLLALDLAGPQLEQMLPADPEALDELLLTGAAWALGLRSDEAPAFALAAGQPELAP